ncbi:MAG TPA: PEGA domain-containing protein [Thermoanaerobaculia bacterium]|nr:PEGA domain-containing protein [Thermoanaerobaculia bacterium]
MKVNTTSSAGAAPRWSARRWLLGLGTLALAVALTATPAFARSSGHSGSSGGHSSGGHSSGGHSGGWHGGTPGMGNHGGWHGSGHSGGFHGGGFHGSPGFHGGVGFHGGFHGGVGFRGYYYPSFWGSIYFGYPFPYWYYGPWGYYAYDGPYDGYGYRDQYRDQGEQGALDLDLSPADTQVYLNGEYIGVVDDFDGWPQYLWLDPGTYDIVFYREGYKTLARQVTIYRGTVIDWDDKLEKGPSIRPEDLPSATHERRDARIEQDREMQERAEHAPPPPPPPGWRDRPSRHRDDAPPPPPPPAAGQQQGRAGRLHLSVEPHDASVYLDGRFLGTADDVSRLSSGLLIDPGQHVLSIVRPGRHAEEQHFEVKDGGDVDLRIVLRNES